MSKDREDVVAPLPAEPLDAETAAQYSKKMHKLLQDEQIVGSYTTMVVGIRLYQLALYRLQTRIAELGEDPVMLSLYREAVKNTAAERFSRGDVLNALQKVALPYMYAEMNEEKSVEMADQRQAESQSEAKRQATPLGNPFMESLARSETLFVVADGQAWESFMTAWLAHWRSQKGEKLAIVWLRNAEGQNTGWDSTRRLAVLPASTTSKRVAIPSQLAALLATWTKRFKSRKPDLVVVDDILAVCKTMAPESSGEPAYAEAHRAFRRYAEENSCGLLIRLPVVADATWSMLGAHSAISRATVKDGGLCIEPFLFVEGEHHAVERDCGGVSVGDSAGGGAAVAVDAGELQPAGPVLAGLGEGTSVDAGEAAGVAATGAGGRGEDQAAGAAG